MAAEQGFWLEDLRVGQPADRTHTVTEADITAFARVCGDSRAAVAGEAVVIVARRNGAGGAA